MEPGPEKKALKRSSSNAAAAAAAARLLAGAGDRNWGTTSGGRSAGREGGAATAPQPPRKVPSREALYFVRSFMQGILKDKPKSTRPKKKPILTAEKIERKREVNRQSSQRKRNREKEELETLTTAFDTVTSSNEHLRKDNEKLMEIIIRVERMKASGTRPGDEETSKLLELFFELSSDEQKEQEDQENDKRQRAGGPQHQKKEPPPGNAGHEEVQPSPKSTAGLPSAPSESGSAPLEHQAKPTMPMQQQQQQQQVPMAAVAASAAGQPLHFPPMPPPQHIVDKPAATASHGTSQHAPFATGANFGAAVAAPGMSQGQQVSISPPQLSHFPIDVQQELIKSLALLGLQSLHTEQRWPSAPGGNQITTGVHHAAMKEGEAGDPAPSCTSCQSCVYQEASAAQGSTSMMLPPAKASQVKQETARTTGAPYEKRQEAVGTNNNWNKGAPGPSNPSPTAEQFLAQLLGNSDVVSTIAPMAPLSSHPGTMQPPQPPPQQYQLAPAATSTGNPLVDALHQMLINAIDPQQASTAPQQHQQQQMMLPPPLNPTSSLSSTSSLFSMIQQPHQQQQVASPSFFQSHHGAAVAPSPAAPVEPPPPTFFPTTQTGGLSHLQNVQKASGAQEQQQNQPGTRNTSNVSSIEELLQNLIQEAAGSQGVKQQQTPQDMIQTCVGFVTQASADVRRNQQHQPQQQEMIHTPAGSVTLLSTDVGRNQQQKPQGPQDPQDMIDSRAGFAIQANSTDARTNQQQSLQHHPHDQPSRIAQPVAPPPGPAAAVASLAPPTANTTNITVSTNPLVAHQQQHGTASEQFQGSNMFVGRESASLSQPAAPPRDGLLEVLRGLLAGNSSSQISHEQNQQDHAH